MHVNRPNKMWKCTFYFVYKSPEEEKTCEAVCKCHPHNISTIADTSLGHSIKKYLFF